MAARYRRGPADTVAPMTDQPYVLHEPLPTLSNPVLVGMLTGWIDASGAAAAALAAIQHDCDLRPLATFDGDTFIDYRARRPTMEMRHGINTRVVWPEIELQVGHDLAGHDLVVLSGPEPDSAWRRFAEVMGELATALGITRAVMLGAYPFATPHTRPPRLSSSSPTEVTVGNFFVQDSSFDVPAGMGGVLEHTFNDRGIQAIGIWAQVPHYVSAMTYPAATVALVGSLQDVSGIVVDAADARREAIVQRERLDQLIAANPEHITMVRQLEEAYDSTPDDGSGPSNSTFSAAEIPSPDELAEEFERFLREQG
jgi:hypothetical protein